MPVQVEVVRSGFVAKIGSLALDGPIDQTTFREVRRVLDEYPVCLIQKDQPILPAQQIALTRGFGAIMQAQRKWQTLEPPRLPYPEIIDISNLDASGNILPPHHRRLLLRRLDMEWHADISFHKNRATYSLLSAHAVPPSGGETGFIDLRHAYDRLSPRLKAKVKDLYVVHSLEHSRSVVGIPAEVDGKQSAPPPVEHKLVQTHPTSGRNTLYFGVHAASVRGLSSKDGRELIDTITKEVTKRPQIYIHQWKVGDLLIWDNLCTMHRSYPFNERAHRRDMRRTTVREYDEMNSVPIA
jgi:alpha-ketoglutarate-dependent 2,4-dichlorophenoxyacetate dioxygenase